MWRIDPVYLQVEVVVKYECRGRNEEDAQKKPSTISCSGGIESNARNWPKTTQTPAAKGSSKRNRRRNPRSLVLVMTEPMSWNGTRLPPNSRPVQRGKTDYPSKGSVVKANPLAGGRSAVVFRSQVVPQNFNQQGR